MRPISSYRATLTPSGPTSCLVATSRLASRPLPRAELTSHLSTDRGSQQRSRHVHLSNESISLSSTRRHKRARIDLGASAMNSALVDLLISTAEVAVSSLNSFTKADTTRFARSGSRMLSLRSSLASWIRELIRVRLSPRSARAIVAPSLTLLSRRWMDRALSRSSSFSVAIRNSMSFSRLQIHQDSSRAASVPLSFSSPARELSPTPRSSLIFSATN